MAYASGEFMIKDAAGNTLHVEAAYTTTFFDNQLYIIWNPDSSNNQNNQNCNFKQTTFNAASANIDTGGATSQSLWTTTPLQIAYAMTDSVMAAVADQGSLYLFWKQVNTNVENQLSAAVMQNGSWSTQQIQLQGTGGVTLWPPNSNAKVSVSATSIGVGSILVACSPASENGSSYNGDTGTLFIGCYNVADINSTQGVWPARWQWFQPASFFGNIPVGNVFYADMDWYPVVSAANQAPQWCLAVSIWDGGSPGTSSIFTCTVTSDGVVTPTALTPNQYPGIVSLCCDPAGRISFCDIPNYGSATGISVGSVSGASAPAPGTGLNLQGIALNELTTGQKVGFIPLLTYGIGAPQTAGNTISYAAYQYVIYSNWDQNLYCQVSRYGTIMQTVQKAPLAPKVTTQKQVLVLQGIVDGPMPVPNQNLTATGTQSLGEVVYGSSESLTAGHKTSTSLTVGFKSTGETSKGIGPAWDISFSQGTGTVLEKTVESKKSQPFICPTESSSTTPGVDPSGFLLANSIAIEATTYQFLDNTNTPVTNATQMVLLRAYPFAHTVQSYIPYSVTPGTLTSYTPEGWNATMQTPGVSNYFQSVIEANAFTFESGSQQPFLELTWGGALVEPQFEQTTTSFTERTWTLSSEVYAGFGGGAGLNLFGLGVDASFQFLAGFSYESEAEVSTESSKTWGIEVSGFNCPGGVITGFTWRLYFLPPPANNPNQWTTELISKLPYPPPAGTVDKTQIDPNSGAWRIVFVVTDIWTNGVNTYHYAGNLGLEAARREQAAPQKRTFRAGS